MPPTEAAIRKHLRAIASELSPATLEAWIDDGTIATLARRAAACGLDAGHQLADALAAHAKCFPPTLKLFEISTGSP